MKKSIFSAALMSLAAMLLIAPTRVEEGGPTPTPAPTTPAPTASSSNLAGGGITIVDSGGYVIAILVGDAQVSMADVGDVDATLRVKASTVPIPAGTELSPTVAIVPGVGKYFPVYDPSAPTSVKVPASTPVTFCSGNAYYNRATGQCSDGKSPSKVVPLNSLSDPAAKTPTVTCNPPTVAMWNSATKQWTCVVYQRLQK